jgi:hypothetical protein
LDNERNLADEELDELGLRGSMDSIGEGVDEK